MNTQIRETARQQAEICKIFGNSNRVLILWALDNQELSVSDLARVIDSSLQNTSQHLRLMQAKGIVTSRREGHIIYYRIADGMLKENCHCLRHTEQVFCAGNGSRG